MEHTENRIFLENLLEMQQNLIKRLEVAGCSTESAEAFLSCVVEQLEAVRREGPEGH